MIFIGGGVLLVCIAFHLAWIGKRAEAKGRNALAWAAVGVALAGLGARAGVALFERADALGSDAVTILQLTAPITLSIGPLVLVALLLMVLPVRIVAGNSWPIHHARDGAGMLVISDEAVELRWADHTDRIARAALTAKADQESVRLAWPEHDVLVMPGGKPANREGRMRQAEALAARLKR